MRICKGLVLLLGLFSSPFIALAADKPEVFVLSVTNRVVPEATIKDTSVFAAYHLPGGPRFGKLQVFLGQVLEQDEIAFEQDAIKVQKAVSAAAEALKTKARHRKQTPSNPPLLSFISGGKWS